MTRILLAGASGMVGREVLRQALADPRVGEIVAPARRPLAADAKLRNPLVDFDALPADAAWWKVDAVICTLGTTIRDAGSQAAFRKVDYDYPLAVARHALAHGASTFVLTSASGASAASRLAALLRHSAGLRRYSLSASSSRLAWLARMPACV